MAQTITNNEKTQSSLNIYRLPSRKNDAQASAERDSQQVITPPTSLAIQVQLSDQPQRIAHCSAAGTI
ncbi:hypothetical protein [Klebsiella pneumoniae]|uniref:hypothetical protein n=1 Tax=Klebsiella pneumoniae TaxID=573 RepID=UPI003C12F8E0